MKKNLMQKILRKERRATKMKKIMMRRKKVPFPRLW